MAIHQQPFIESVKETLHDFNMLEPGDRVLVAVSGGPDSMALLHALLTVQDDFKIQMGVAHLNHGLRPSAADRDAAFVQSRCRKEWHLPFHLEKEDLLTRHQHQKGSLEALGRQARFDFFKRISRAFNYTKIALGHHAADNAELILMNLFRGSGLLGLSGIPPIREKCFIRPLIHQPREEILAFLRKNKIDFVLDTSNRDHRFLRNRIRHELMPDLIHRFNPKLVETLSRTATILRSDEAFLDQQAHQILDTLSIKHATHVRIPISVLFGLHEALQRRLIRVSIAHVRGHLKRITLHHIDTVLKLCKKDSGNWQLHLPDRLIVHKDEKDEVSFFRSAVSPRNQEDIEAEPASPPLYKVFIPGSEEGVQRSKLKALNTTLALRAISVDSLDGLTSVRNDLKTEIGPEDFFEMASHPYTAFLDMDRLTSPLHIRYIRPGDRFMPLGMTGTQKVKNFLINSKIPRETRNKTLVLLSGDTIVWLVGLRIDQRFKISQQTRNVLKIEVFLA